MLNEKTALLVPFIPNYANHPVHPQFSSMLHHLRSIYDTKKLTTFGEAVQECASNPKVAVVWIDGLSPVQDGMSAENLAINLRMQRYNGLLMLARQDDGSNGVLEAMLDSLVLAPKDRTHTWVYDPARPDSPKTDLLISQLIHYATSNRHLGREIRQQ